MLFKRKKPSDGTPGAACAPRRATSSSLFSPKTKLVVCRAPIMQGLTVSNCSAVNKKFQRPMAMRRTKIQAADLALQKSSLGQKRRFDGMSKLMARAGKGLSFKLPSKTDTNNDSDDSDNSDDEDDKNKLRDHEPLCLWRSPHSTEEEIEAQGLPPRLVKEKRCDESGVEMIVDVIKPAPKSAYAKEDVFVPPVLAQWLRPHQREGVQFMYNCVMGLKDPKCNGCILADDMGLGKTLQSVVLIYTLLKTGITADKQATAKRVIVVCPCSLVKNWDNEFTKWLGAGVVKTLPLAEADRKSIEKNLDSFAKTKIFSVLICSYECLRSHAGRLTKFKDCCDLLVCDEAHRLKNSDNQTSKALNSLPVKRRVLLTGTPMQNDLGEFFAMADFTNAGILGTNEEFRRKYLSHILRGREPDATEAQKRKMQEKQYEMSSIVNEFILRRVNSLNAQHLPPKLVQVVCCNLTEIQQNMYQHLISSKDMQHVLDGKQVNCLSSIQMLMKLSNHPSLIAEEDKVHGSANNGGKGRRAAAKRVQSYSEDPATSAAPGADGVSKFLPYIPQAGGRGNSAPVHPEWSGKMFVLYRLMKEMRKPGNGGDKIVIVSNYTQTLDLIGSMCRENSWGFCRLDGSITMKKRQKMVDEFNDPSSPLIAFLLSSKAGGCGLNLIGGNRLVLFDPDWNPAVDKQAAARCWRDGQRKRCFTYRFLATGTVEEKIFQRQLSKEGLQSVVDDKDQVNELSTKDLRNLFKLRTGTPSDTHDKLKCKRCSIIQDNAEMEELKVLPLQLSACKEFLDVMVAHEDAEMFKLPLKPEDHGKTKEEYEKLVKQPMDFDTIRKKLEIPVADPSSPSTLSAGHYKSISNFSKDVNRIFTNVMKVWSPGDDIADSARRLQAWWLGEWTDLVPRLMSMKAEDNNESKKCSSVAGEGGEVDAILESCASINNERGDNYQEQIGMPDEENMRSWSHHYSADTVDDPVFRAAMRGCDAVSFVFGLEVTWSLIQQRQQEDEEREAMKMLESIEEVDEMETEENADGIDNGKPVSVAVNSPVKAVDNSVAKSEAKSPTRKDEKTTLSPNKDNSAIDEDDDDSSEDNNDDDLGVDIDDDDDGSDEFVDGENEPPRKRRTV